MSAPTPGRPTVSVAVEPGAHAPSGRDALVRVHVRNLTDGPQDITVAAIGLDGAWTAQHGRAEAVPADVTVTFELAVSIARGAVPGVYAFAFAVQGQGPGGAGAPVTVVDTSLTVDAPSSVVLGVEPAEVTAVFGKDVTVVLSNAGETPADLLLDSTANSELRVELTSQVVTVPPHATVRMPARITVAHPRVVGARDRSPYSVLAHGDRAPASFHGVLTARPVLSSGILKALAMLTAVALWATAIAFVVPWLSHRAGQADVVAGTQSGSGTGDGSGGSADGSGGSDAGGAGGSGGPSGSGGGSGSTAGGTGEEVRIGGVITAADPSGFQVEIVPAGQLVSQTSATVGDAASIAGAALVTGDGGGGAATGKVSASALALQRTAVADPARTTSSLDDGTWAVAGMSPQTNYLITVSKPGFQTQRFEMSGAAAAATPLKIAMVAGAGQMSGRITGPGGAIGGASITITDGTNVVTTSTATEGDVGSWSVDGLSTPSTYLVTVAGTGYGAQSRLVPLDAGGSAVVNLPLTHGVASLAGTVTGPDALGAIAGLGGLTITATDGTTTRTASSVTSGQVGAFVLADLPVPSTYTVTVSGAGYASQTTTITLGTGRAAARLDIRLGLSTGVVQGTVKNPSGKGLGGAGLTLTDGENTYKTMSTSDASGTFRFNGIAPGSYVLSSELFGHVDAYAPVTVTAGKVSTADLEMTPIPGSGLLSTSVIRGRVSDARTNGQITCTNLAPTETCEITVTMTAPGADGSTRNISVTSAPDLEYVIPGPGDEGLLPGLYVLTISVPGYEPGTVSVRVPMDQTVEAAQVALYPSPSVVGTILTRVGAVPAGTCVIAWPTGSTGSPGPCTVGTDAAGDPTCVIGDPAQCAGTATDGSYALERLGSGQFDVSVQPGDDEYLPVAPVAIVLTPGDVRRYDATLDRQARVAVSVLSDDGSSSLLPASGAVVTPVRLSPGAFTPPTTPWTTGASGQVVVTHLPAGTYRFDVSWTTGSPAVELTASSAELTVGTNQELTTQVVLTRARAAFGGTVVTQLTATAFTPVGSAAVQLTGVTGYSGLVPVTSSATAITNANGEFQVVASLADVVDASTVYLPLVTDQVTVSVTYPFAGTAPYRTLVRTNIPISDLAAPLVLEPTGRPFSGTITYTGAPAPTAAEIASTTFVVEQAPPGASNAGLSAVATGGGAAQLVWTDLSQPSDPSTTGATMARPGTYRVRASLAGFDSQVLTFTIPVLPAALPAVTFDLPRFGDLTVEVVTGAGATPVPDPVVTLIRPASGNITTAAVPGTNRVAFGQMASGTYQVSVQAAGYRFDTFSVTVAAGQSTPIPVTVVKLGEISGTVSVQRSSGITSTLSGVTVQATMGSVTLRATTDATGAYRITGTTTTQGLNAGTWAVSVVAAGYSFLDGSSSVSVAVTEGQTSTTNLTLKADPQNLTITVYDPDDATSTAVNALRVSLIGPDGTREIDCTAVTTSCPTTPTGGQYVFTSVAPGTYTLAIAGGGFAPLTVNITVAAGEPTLLTLPIAARSNTVSGTVSGQAGAAAAVPLDGATVELWSSPAGTDPVASTTTTSGAFSLTGIADGQYTIVFTADGYGSSSRTITLSGGQQFTADVVLYTVARQVTVTLTSAQGFDLTGALVTLAPDGGGLSLAAQPVVRTGQTTFATTFNQVPPGAWTASASGPAGHVGTFTAAVSDTATTAAITVSEMRIRVTATSSAADAPSMPFTVTRSSGNDSGTTVYSGTAGIDTGAEVVYVDRTSSYAVTPSVSGWQASPSSVTVSTSTASVTEVTAAFTLSKVGTTTTLAASATTISPGDALTLTATVSPGSGGASGLNGGTVTFSRDGTPIPGDVTLTGTGGTRTATLTPDTSAWTGGTTSFTATFNGTTTFAGSTSSAVTVTVRFATATVLASDTSTFTAGTSTAIVLTATVTRTSGTVDSGTVTFRAGATTLGTGTVSGGTATLTVPGTTTSTWSAGTVSLTAEYGATSTLAGSTSSAVTVTVTAAGG
ncbi:carboxypeptidase regulatory-like domain-containing protein [Actinotalea sp. M2MS4P-6]|uniref:carboxypeptidase regulatory-like domain-containing protein n=1 Tax=Actinotalea sp. M2MS4P-6 TaxID=2983762 RepID=UPI0021E49C54|nr:carboxypeptidase regulatory-like domain-containing protein [Actinotalea sp. M2MS4P-6]MCV2395221.1 carboxypeptidase regulatory-like domain-containing protein [Actinotalea sp. M2MS4P-6]